MLRPESLSNQMFLPGGVCVGGPYFFVNASIASVLDFPPKYLPGVASPLFGPMEAGRVLPVLSGYGCVRAFVGASAHFVPFGLNFGFAYVLCTRTPRAETW